MNSLQSKSRQRMGRLNVLIQIAVDLLIFFLSSIVSLLLVTFNRTVFSNYILSIILWCIIMTIVYTTMYYISGEHRVFWKYSSTNDIIKYELIVIFSFILTFVIHYTVAEALLSSKNSLNMPLTVRALPLSAYPIGLLMSLVILTFTVFVKKSNNYESGFGEHFSEHKGKDDDHRNIMIIGGGYTGNLMINDLRHNTACAQLRPVCIIDDDESKFGKAIQGVPIVGGRDSIDENVKKYGVDIIIFAIPSCDTAQKAQILKLCAHTGCEVKTVPTLTQIVSGEASISQTRQIEIEDLLGREPIHTDLEKVMEYVEGKTIMVTGGGGSIGSELCRQLASHSPKRLIIFDIYENNAYDISNELKRDYPNLDLVTLIGSVRDTSRLDSVIGSYKPDIIYHAAAHKHVPLMEDSPNEAVKNNVLGTYKLACAADKYGVKRFVMISTDKAVNPTNIMGATKRICEMIVQSFNNHSSCEFVAVRFGNVLGSNGSVIPLFKKQIANGGPVTVTHPDIIRYFMTIPEAVSLVLQAGAYAKGGEIFVLDMGSPVKILDLAKNLITLMGHVPGEDIKIEFTGLRPGEKLYEELLMEEEGLKATDNKRIHIGHPINFDEDVLFSKLKELERVMYDDEADVRQIVKELVPTYNYKKE